jgi:hypothetical protein
MFWCDIFQVRDDIRVVLGEGWLADRLINIIFDWKVMHVHRDMRCHHNETSDLKEMTLSTCPLLMMSWLTCRYPIFPCSWGTGWSAYFAKLPDWEAEGGVLHARSQAGRAEPKQQVMISSVFSSLNVFDTSYLCIHIYINYCYWYYFSLFP